MIFRCVLFVFVLNLLGACSGSKAIPKAISTPSQVLIVDSIFTMEGLDRERQLRIYLPPNYDHATESYPVLYMHDAQNLFDDATSYAGEWGVDENLDSLSQVSDINIIVVGIDNGGGNRIHELSPWENEKYGAAEGEEYMQFIVDQVKPYVDANFRTLVERKNTAIMGSSLGGLISHYAIFRYPEVFGKAGIMSPSYWYAEAAFEFTKSNPLPNDSRLYMTVGEQEGDEDMVVDASRMYKELVDQGLPLEDIKFMIDAKGKHNEATWRRQFPVVIKWLFSEL